MRNVTHQFGHIETLERAKRWLIQAGIDPSRIEVRTQGMLTLAVAVEMGESAEVKRIIDAAEALDPDGNPGIWDLANQRHVYPVVDTATVASTSEAHAESFVVAWHPQDSDREVTQTDTDVARQVDYRDGRE